MKTAIRPSVRMSVDPVPVYQSKREVSKNFKFSEKKTSIRESINVKDQGHTDLNKLRVGDAWL